MNEKNKIHREKNPQRTRSGRLARRHRESSLLFLNNVNNVKKNYWRLVENKKNYWKNMMDIQIKILELNNN